jgi:hypothetical protein
MTIRYTNLSRIIILFFPFLILFSCTGGRNTGNIKLVLTEAPGNIVSPDYLSGVSWRYLPGARISEFTLNKPGSMKILTKDFYSACFPDISYDGKFMVFAGQKKEGDTWDIWEMDLAKGKYHKITSSKDNCTDPAYLPGGRLVFSKQTVNDTVRNSHCLFTCNLDGTGLQQITFSPQSFFASAVLKDGRIICVGTRTFPENGEPVLMVMRPDGTKADMFYRDTDGHGKIISSISETIDGKLLFAESDRNNNGYGRLISISYARPLYSRTDLSPAKSGDFLYVCPIDNSFLASFRNTGSERFSLYEFDKDGGSPAKEILTNPDYNIIDFAVAEPYQRPKKLPSEVDPLVKTGLILCQDANFRESLTMVNNYAGPKADRIEVLGVDTTYGIIKVEDDGSFYLKVMADKPFMIRTLDENGNQVGDHCSWLWLRPNERRGCVGCHEDPEFVPDNRVSFAIKKDPVIVPVHINEIIEKQVELE